MKLPRRAWLALALTALAVTLLALAVDPRAVLDVLRRASPGLALASLALLAVGTVVYAWRWRLLLAHQARWSLIFHAANLGHAVNSLVPLRAGEAARVVALSRAAGLPMSQVASSVVVERMYEVMLRLAALIGALVFGLGLLASPLAILGAGLFLAGGAGAVWWLVRNQASVLERWPAWLARLPRISERRARRSLESLLRGMSLAAAPARLAVGLAWTLVAWGCYWGFYALVLLALPINLALGDLLTLSLGALALLPPSAPTAPGIYHAALVLPLGLLGYRNSDLTAFALLANALLMGFMLPLGLLGLRYLGASPRGLLAAPVQTTPAATTHPPVPKQKT